MPRKHTNMGARLHEKKGDEGRGPLQSKSNLQPQADSVDSPHFPGSSATFSSAPITPGGARGLPTRGPRAPESPGPCHTARTAHRFPRAQPAATTATWLLGLRVPAHRFFPFRSNLRKQPPAPPRLNLGLRPGVPGGWGGRSPVPPYLHSSAKAWKFSFFIFFSLSQ